MANGGLIALSFSPKATRSGTLSFNRHACVPGNQSQARTEAVVLLFETWSGNEEVDNPKSQDVPHLDLFPPSPHTWRGLHEPPTQVHCVQSCRLLYNSTCVSMSRLGKRGCTVLVLYFGDLNHSGRARDRRIGECALVKLLGSCLRFEFCASRLVGIFHACTRACLQDAARYA